MLKPYDALCVVLKKRHRMSHDEMTNDDQPQTFRYQVVHIQLDSPAECGRAGVAQSPNWQVLRGIGIDHT